MADTDRFSNREVDAASDALAAAMIDKGLKKELYGGLCDILAVSLEDGYVGLFISKKLLQAGPCLQALPPLPSPFKRDETHI